MYIFNVVQCTVYTHTIQRCSKYFAHYVCLIPCENVINTAHLLHSMLFFLWHIKRIINIIINNRTTLLCPKLRAQLFNRLRNCYVLLLKLFTRGRLWRSVFSYSVNRAESVHGDYDRLGQFGRFVELRLIDLIGEISVDDGVYWQHQYKKLRTTEKKVDMQYQTEPTLNGKWCDVGTEFHPHTYPIHTEKPVGITSEFPYPQNWGTVCLFF